MWKCIKCLVTNLLGFMCADVQVSQVLSAGVDNSFCDVLWHEKSNIEHSARAEDTFETFWDVKKGIKNFFEAFA